MRFTARAKLDTWAHASRVQSDEVTYGLRMEPAALAAGNCDGACGDGAGRADVDVMEHAARSGRLEVTDDAYRQLMKHAHRLAMDGHGELAQFLRDAMNDAQRYSWLRDRSDSDLCRYYLASDDPAAKFNDPKHVDRQIDTDRANVVARERARSA